MSLVLKSRDEELLADLARYRYLTTTQAATLRYPSRQVASRRLRKLERASYVARFRAVAVPGHGSNDYIHHLTPAGAELVASRLGVSPAAIAFPARTREVRHGYSFDHILGIVQFWLSLDLAAAAAGLSVERFIPEWHTTSDERGHPQRTLKCAVPHPLRPSQTLTFIPDAALILRRGERRVLRFLEVDRSTLTVTSTSWPDFTDRLYGYRGLLESEGYRRFGDFDGFQLLLTTVTAGRRESYRQAACEVGLPEHVLVADAEAIAPTTILERIWHPPAPAAPPRALIVSTAAAPAPAG